MIRTSANVPNDEESPGRKRKQYETSITRSKRDAPPARYTLQIESFSKLREMLKKPGIGKIISDSCKKRKYESDEFESGGYKWKLVLDPCVDPKEDGSDQIALYIAIADPNTIPFRSQVHVILKFFIYDQIRDKYMIFQDDGVRRYHSFKTENGLDHLISLWDFNDPSNGFLVNDCCSFGAEVHVINYESSSDRKGEKFSIVQLPKYDTYTWKIKSFSELKEERHFSPIFTAAQHKWKLGLYPKGYSPTENGRSLSLFLHLPPNNNKNEHRGQSLYVEYKLKVKNHLQERHVERTGSVWMINNDVGWGYQEFMPLEDINDASNGYLVNDTLIVEVTLAVLSDKEPLP